VAWQLDVQQPHVGTHSIDVGNGRAPIAGLTDDVEAVSVEQHPSDPAEWPMVVDHQHAQHVAVPRATRLVAGRG